MHAVIYAEKMGPYSLNGKTSYCQISWSIGAASLDVIMIASFWNLADIGNVTADVPAKFQSD